jgi:hypothetical protein
MRNGETAGQSSFLKPVLPECNMTQAAKVSFAQMRSILAMRFPLYAQEDWQR